MRALLITPPMLLFNAPYAATPRLTGCLRAQGIAVTQADLSLELALCLFSRRTLEAIAKNLPRRPAAPAVHFFLRHRARYAATVEGAGRPAGAGRRIQRSPPVARHGNPATGWVPTTGCATGS